MDMEPDDFIHEDSALTVSDIAPQTSVNYKCIRDKQGFAHFLDEEQYSSHFENHTSISHECIKAEFGLIKGHLYTIVKAKHTPLRNDDMVCLISDHGVVIMIPSSIYYSALHF